ncbi:hypothetical protein AUO94_07170 [Planococcus kocurii]|uniref:Cytochrome c oxidase subunit 4 n=1 Tax=Planococcus kocurii TaxID=1374 RepID=A0ABM5WVT9_9BACL|nr:MULTISPECIES: hypothetical protein [Planococcus]ALS78456.1 hypothetical protein AUO94_07170 [Planococcus kocurii]MCH4826914.1 emp24/gp25L/p24 family protein [Planococcus halocryophilus]
MYGWLNIGSLILGLIAWALPIAMLAKHNKENNKRLVLFSIASISACVISLCFQILYQDYLVRIEDWSALADTSKAVVRLSFLLAIVTILLNVITALVYNKKVSEN